MSRWEDLRLLVEMYREGVKARRKFQCTSKQRVEAAAEIRAIRRVLMRMDQLETRKTR